MSLESIHFNNQPFLLLKRFIFPANSTETSGDRTCYLTASYCLNYVSQIFKSKQRAVSFL